MFHRTAQTAGEGMEIPDLDAEIGRLDDLLVPIGVGTGTPGLIAFFRGFALATSDKYLLKCRTFILLGIDER